MSVFLSSYRQAIAFRPERFNPLGLAGSDRMKVILACFEPEQFIPLHQPGVDLALLVLEGEGQLIAGDQEEPIGPGALAFVAAGEARAIRATTRLVVLHIVAPPPTEADHAEVVKRLAAGAWR